jgi:hypothetical protein
VLDATEQIGVYRQQYRLRMWRTLIDEIPGLFALLGQDAPQVLWAYLDACPSQSWTLADLAVGLPAWLQDQGADVSRIEMAWLDVSVNRGFTAGEGHDVDPSILSTAPRLGLQPHVGLRRCRTDVHRWRTESAAGETPAPLETGDFPLVVYRRDLRMRHRVVPVPWFTLLQALHAGRGLGQSLEDVVASGVDAEWLSGQVSNWFRDMVAWRWIEAVPEDG